MNEGNEGKVVRYVERFRSLVAGPGFEAFFRADAGDHAQATLNALLVIGALDAAALLRRAMWVFEGCAPPRGRAARVEALGRIGETERSLLLRLDESFRDCDDELTRSLADYARSVEEPYCVA